MEFIWLIIGGITLIWLLSKLLGSKSEQNLMPKSSLDMLIQEQNFKRIENFTHRIIQIIQEGMDNFSADNLLENQKLEVFLFDACMIKNILLAEGKISNDYIFFLDKEINTTYRNLRKGFGLKISEQTLEAKDLINIRSSFYVQDIEGLLKCDYPRTKMYIPYGLYFFIHVAPLDTVWDTVDIIEEIEQYRLNRKLSSISSFMKNFDVHYNWLMVQIRSFK